MSGGKDRLGQGGNMKDEWTSTDTLLRAVAIDTESLVAMLYELARRNDDVREQARESAESLLMLLDELALRDTSREEGEEA